MGNKLYYFQLCIEPTLKIGMYSEVKEKKITFNANFFSSPDPKGHVRYCHHLASVVRPSSVR